MSIKSYAAGNRTKTSSVSSAKKLEDLIASQKPIKEKVGILTRIGNVVQAFEPGAEINTYLKTGNLGKSVKQYTSEVARGLGSAIPFLDAYVKPNEVERNRQGFREVLNTLGMSKKGPWDDILGITGDIVLDPGNLLLAGLFKVVGKGLKYAGVGIKGIAENFEVGKKLIGTTDEFVDVFRRNFIPGAKTAGITSTKAVSGLGETVLEKGTDYNKMKSLYKDWYEYRKLVVKDQGIAFAQKLPDEKNFYMLSDWIMSGHKTPIDESVKKVALQYETWMKEIAMADQGGGILTKLRRYYFPLSKKNEELILTSSPLNTFLGANKKRTSKGTLREINEALGKE